MAHRPDPTTRAAVRVESLSRQLTAARTLNGDECSSLERNPTAAAAGAFASQPPTQLLLLFPQFPQKKSKKEKKPKRTWLESALFREKAHPTPPSPTLLNPFPPALPTKRGGEEQNNTLPHLLPLASVIHLRPPSLPPHPRPPPYSSPDLQTNSLAMVPNARNAKPSKHRHKT